MGAPNYDRFSLTAKAEGRDVSIVIGISKAVVASSNDARRAALVLREAADRAEMPIWSPAEGEGNTAGSAI